jgi:hypothetical protein
MLAAVQRAAGLAVVALLVAASAFNLACALGYGKHDVVRGHAPPGSSIVGFVALLGFVGAIAVSAACVARRPHRVVALVAPCAGLLVLTYDFTYDTYFAPSLQRYWAGSTDMGTHVALAFLIAGATAPLAWLRPRVGAAVTIFAVPLTAIALVTYIGH